MLTEKLSPALEQVDSSSGALGSAVNRAIDVLVPIIAAPDDTESVREAWLERLFDALQEDRMPYIEHLDDFWGQLCVTPSIASAWAERLLGTTTRVLGPDGHGEFFTGTTACLSALYGAQRYDELIRLVDSALQLVALPQLGSRCVDGAESASRSTTLGTGFKESNAPLARPRQPLRRSSCSAE
ncbi:hypothetical protein [Caballeronia sp. LjRoot29]|uniref:hypothetical protein n=1 Tax=Caballeronia sp. LjRoot29 TaxID=3342315 RepID=UPI003F4F69FD